ncbi:hypothetical protein PNOK_0439000 [Pyrrhoderma noxium]|uniref:G-protein coupled receptors family 1 profile domain-containing protein n=1 Tax=Pyrrhoderma noxium TaxID=2282107 RepID=A0A286UIJ9_9AGAM|nr:hypothetical protein PNOK_0439000 [Pyrrhoderma noxium]
MARILSPSFFFPLRDQIDPSGQIQYSPNAIIIFFVFQILGGHVGIPFILLTFYLSKGIPRHPLLINFLVTWMIYSTSFCILLYLGKQFGPEPPHSFCAIQSSLIYGTAVLTPTAGLAFVFNFWLKLRALAVSRSAKETTFQKCTLVAAPYIVFALTVVVTACFGATNPELVSRNRYTLYCTIHSDFVDIVPALAAIILFILIVLECFIVIKLYQYRRETSHLRLGSGINISIFLRAGIFSLYSFLSLIACIAFWSRTGAEIPYIFQASLPTAAFVIFGSQKDLLEAWYITYIWSRLRHGHNVLKVTLIK